MPVCSLSIASLGTPLRSALNWAADQKAAMVEIDARRQLIPDDLTATARRQIRHMLSERSLKLSGLLFPLRGGIADLDRLADRIDLAFKCMELGRELGAEGFVVPFRMPEADVDIERTLEVLFNLANHGDRVGCPLMLRTGDGSEAMPPFVREAARAAPILIQFDPAGCLLGGYEIEKTIMSLADMVRQFRACDAIRSGSSLGRETAIGRGEVDFDLLAALSHQLDVRAVVVSPDDANVAPLADGLKYTTAVFGGFGM